MKTRTVVRSLMPALIAGALAAPYARPVMAAASPAFSSTLSPYQTLQGGSSSGRSYYFYKPTSANGGTAYNGAQGMIIVLHGGFDYTKVNDPDHAGGKAAASGETDYLFERLADSTGMLVIYPNGLYGSWNSCTSTSSDPFGTRKPDDVKFIEDVIADVSKSGGIAPGLDKSRVYVAGHSEGAKMAERLALQANTQVAAVAVIAGNNPVGNDHTGAQGGKGGDSADDFVCKDSYTTPWEAVGSATNPPVPVMLIKGDHDPRIWFGDHPEAVDASHPDAAADPNDYCQIKDPSHDYHSASCITGKQMSFQRTIAFWQWKLGLPVSSNPALGASPDPGLTWTSPNFGSRREPGAPFIYRNTVATCADPQGAPIKNGSPTCGLTPDPVNGTAPAPTKAQLAHSDGSYVARYTYGSGSQLISGAYPLVVYRAYGGGHDVPGPLLQGQAQWEASGWKNHDALGATLPGQATAPPAGTYIAGDIYAFFSQFTQPSALLPRS